MVSVIRVSFILLRIRRISYLVIDTLIKENAQGPPICTGSISNAFIHFWG
jgi:hypothetical protein